MSDFEFFKRENPFIGDLDPGENPLITWPLYRHFEEVPERDAINDPESVPSNDAPPVDDPPVSSSPSEESAGDGGPTEDSVGDDDIIIVDEDDAFVTNPCIFDEDGNFNAYATANTVQTDLDYKYKIETLSGFASLEDEVVPYVEKMILQMLVPKIFDCENVRSLSSGLRHGNRRLALAGASSSPNDVISDTGESNRFQNILKYRSSMSNSFKSLSTSRMYHC